MEHFDYIWDHIVCPVVDACLDEADKQFAEEFRLLKKQSRGLKSGLHREYHAIREAVKCDYHSQNLNGKLDMDKLAAVFCYALIKQKACTFDNIDFSLEHDYSLISESYIVNNYLINYKIAFHVALGIAYLGFMRTLSARPENTSVIEALKTNGCLKLYDHTQNGHDSFFTVVVKGLLHCDLTGKDFDFLLFSNLLYGIEEYNYLLFMK